MVSKTIKCIICQEILGQVDKESFTLEDVDNYKATMQCNMGHADSAELDPPVEE